MVSQFSFYVALTWQTFKVATKIYCHYQFGLWPKNKTNIYSRLRKSSRRSFFPQESKCPPKLTHTRPHGKKLAKKKKRGRGSLKASPRGKHSHVWQEFWLHFQTSSITLESSEYTTRALQGFQEFTAVDAVWKFLTDRNIQTCRICA